MSEKEILIGIDIDGVITDFEKYMKEKGKQYLNREIVNQRGYDIADTFNVSQEMENVFWDKHIIDYATNCPVRKDFIFFIKQLQLKDWNWCIITNRCNDISYCNLLESEMKNLVNDYINKIIEITGDLGFKGIYFSKNETGLSKCDLINKLGIDAMFEDSPNQIPQIIEKCNIPIYMMETSYNYHLCGNGIIHIQNWEDMTWCIAKGNMDYLEC